MIIEYEIFIKYVRTKQLMNERLKGNETVKKPVHIPQKEIEQRFFVYPDYDRKEALNYLVAVGELKITSMRLPNGRTMKLYHALKEGEIDLMLLKEKPDNFTNPIIKQMREYLREVSLSDNAPSTIYFDLFLQNKFDHLNLFFTVDDFARRIHTPITNFHREYRSNILFFNDEVTSLDVATMQPLLLGKILKKEIGENEFSNWINTGKDIYLMLQEKANLNTRDEAKKRFFEILFSKPSESLSKLFGASNWIEWINNYKTLIIADNPHNKQKPHSNLAWLLQTTEVEIMYKVWKRLFENKIPFLTVHDEIMIRRKEGTKAEKLFCEVLNNEFEYYKLNNKVKTKQMPNVTIVANENKPVIENKDDWNISELKQFFKSIKLPSSPIKLNKWSTIFDIQKYIESNLAVLEKYSGNNYFLSHLNNMNELRKYLTAQ